MNRNLLQLGDERSLHSVHAVETLVRFKKEDDGVFARPTGFLGVPVTVYSDKTFGQNPFRFRPTQVIKPRIFVSYHHQRDQAYYDRFATSFADDYNIITDTSIDRRIGSDNVDYQQQVIREEHIAGSSVTIVLCGAETWKRRWVDWEIHMTLNKRHVLLGICLPNTPRDMNGKVVVPDRLHANIVSGYAQFIAWTEDPRELQAAIDTAKEKARQTRNIDNSAPRMERSRP